MIRIPFIYAEKCDHCSAALSMIESAIGKCKNISCKIAKFKYDTKAAIAIAANKNINTLPGFVIGNEVFQGEDYDEKIIMDAIKKASK